MDADAPPKPDSTADARCPGCATRDRRIAELERRLAEVEKLLDASRRGGKRQAAPFSKGPPMADPRPPGRKSGEDYGTKAFRAVPAVIDETYEAPLPQQCRHYGAKGADGGASAVVPTQVDAQYQVEIPRRPIYRKFNVHVGRCSCCGKRVQGRHALQTSDALGCCASQVGADAQAAVVTLNKEMGLPYGKISRVFETLFGMKLTRGGACQIMLRTSERCEHTYKEIVQHTQTAPRLVPDETGWRVGGQMAWLHVAVTDKAVAYLVHAKRGFEAMSLLLGADYAGKMTHDGWAPYDRFWRAIHQTCLGHLLRRCKEMLETAMRGAVIFPRKVKAILQQALAIRDQRDAGEILPVTAIRYADRLDIQMEQLLLPTKQHAGNERFAEHLWNHRDQLFTFLRHEDVDATNHLAEQAIRPAVVNRKVWGGNRTDDGAAAQSILMSVLATAAKLGRDALDFVSRTLRASAGSRPSLFLSG
jgi:transposase